MRLQCSPETAYGEDVTETVFGNGEVGTSVSYVDNGQSGEASESYETSGSEASETEESGSAELAPRKEVPKALLGTLAVILSAAAVVLIMLLSRRLVFGARRKRLTNAPCKAAAHMYKMLLSVSGEENIPEVLADRLEAVGVSKELTEAVVNAALKARFGGGIDISEAKEAYAALSSAMEIINKDKDAFNAALLWITARDRYM